MNQLTRIERQNDRIIELLKQITGRQLPGAGGVVTVDGGVFSPGSGPIPHQRDTEHIDVPDDPAEKAAILERARAERTAAAAEARNQTHHEVPVAP